MTEQTKKIVSIYTEATPNPGSMKFVVNRMIYSRKSIEFKTAEDVQGRSAFAEALFQLPKIKSLFISNNYVTVSKEEDVEWMEMIQSIKDLLLLKNK